MVDPNVILHRVEQIEKHLGRILPFADLPYDDFVKDPVAQDVVEYNLFQIVNHLIDMFQHAVIDEGLGYPESAYEASRILFEKGFLNREEMDVFKRMVGFRNIVGHDYIHLDKEVVHRILTRGEKDIRSLLTRIATGFLNKNPHKLQV